MRRTISACLNCELHEVPDDEPSLDEKMPDFNHGARQRPPLEQRSARSNLSTNSRAKVASLPMVEL
jgi:hypothetical protein